MAKGSGNRRGAGANGRTPGGRTPGGRSAGRKTSDGRSRTGAKARTGAARIRYGLAALAALVVVVALAGLGTAWLDRAPEPGADGLTMAVNRPAPTAITGIPRLNGRDSEPPAAQAAQDPDRMAAAGEAQPADAGPDAIGDLIQQLERGEVPRGNAEGADDEVLAALPPEPEETWPDRAGPSGEAGFARIAIVIDDLGGSAEAVRRLMALPGPVTYAFLTANAGTPDQARMVAAAGLDVMLHMPMEPQGEQNPGPNALLVGNTAEENLRRLKWHLARLPGAIGLNNHMGSRFTADAAQMRPVLEAANDAQLFYLDSRTSGRSVGYQVARELPMPALQRDIFLDHDPVEDTILRQLRHTEAVAAREGSAIAIGHPYPETLAVLERWMPQAQARGYVLVGISDLVPARQPATVRKTGAAAAGLTGPAARSGGGPLAN
ncbi:divergent polysaccharide deacetylase family protein [Marinibaculum pumilum]|uniref:Divergent polysaccharide deacetylase family protein n=1 Tax=Marinibaculum pumilum TaxID=1766165 RepID=A0ABV7KUB9_9PROT